MSEDTTIEHVKKKINAVLTLRESREAQKQRWLKKIGVKVEAMHSSEDGSSG